MLRATLLLAALLSAAATGQGEDTSTALAALKLLPKEEAKRLARIEARDARPTPDRWHLLVHDPAAENGLREYVVAGGAVVASRGISQFADTINLTQIIGEDPLKTDSDRVLRLARDYAEANDASVAATHLELAREGPAVAPQWKATCQNTAGQTVGTLVVSAAKGTVTSHEGFARDPAPATLKQEAKVEREPDKPKRRIDTPPLRIVTRPERDPAIPRTEGEIEQDREDAERRAEDMAEAREKAKDDARDRERDRERQRERMAEEGGRGDANKTPWFRRAGGALQRTFTGRDTISR